jgi:hypothetical protein
MKKKLISIGIIGTFLLTSILGVSVVGMKIGKTDDPWIEITQPDNEEKLSFPILIESRGSSDIDFVLYAFCYRGEWFSSTLWKAENPPYSFLFTKSHLLQFGVFVESGQLKIIAAAYKNSDNGGFYRIAESEVVEIVIEKRSRPVFLIEDIFSQFPVLSRLIKL